MKGLISGELALCALAKTEKDSGLISGELALHAEINEDNGLISGEPAPCAHAQIDERKGLLHGELALLLRTHNERLTKTKACTHRILTGG